MLGLESTKLHHTLKKCVKRADMVSVLTIKELEF